MHGIVCTSIRLIKEEKRCSDSIHKEKILKLCLFSHFIALEAVHHRTYPV